MKQLTRIFSFVFFIIILESTANDIQTYKEKLIDKGDLNKAVRLTQKAYKWAILNKASIQVDKSFIDS